MNNELISSKEMAEILHCKKGSLYPMYIKGVIPAPIATGKPLFWARSKVEKWIAKGCRKRKTRKVKKQAEKS